MSLATATHGHRIPARPLYGVLFIALLAAVALTGEWAALAAGMLGPDVALLLGIGRGLRPGQLHPRAVPLYNALHVYHGPALLLAASAWLGKGAAAGAIAWAAHVSMDRAVGYGLRTRDGFQR